MKKNKTPENLDLSIDKIEVLSDGEVKVFCDSVIGEYKLQSIWLYNKGISYKLSEFDYITINLKKNKL
jgi:hypothetical protein